MSILGFNSRTLGRVRPPHSKESFCSDSVSIHAPWEGCDASTDIVRRVEGGFNSRTLGRVRLSCNPKAKWLLEFQFTHPGKGATVVCNLGRISQKVSIHAPWEGCDWMPATLSPIAGSFNSRTLGRVRPGVNGIPPILQGSFNSRTLGRVRLLCHCRCYR